MGLFSDIIRDASPRPARQSPAGSVGELPAPAWPDVSLDAAPALDPVAASDRPGPVLTTGETADPSCEREFEAETRPQTASEEAGALAGAPPRLSEESAVRSHPQNPAAVIPAEPLLRVHELPVVRSHVHTPVGNVRSPERLEAMSVKPAHLDNPEKPLGTIFRSITEPDSAASKSISREQDMPPARKTSPGAVVPEVADGARRSARGADSLRRGLPSQPEKPLPLGEEWQSQRTGHPIAGEAVPVSRSDPEPTRAAFAHMLQDSQKTSAAEPGPPLHREPPTPMPRPVSAPNHQFQRTEEPRVHIGQIDVVVAAPVPNQRAVAAAKPDLGFSSRHYLRSL